MTGAITPGKYNKATEAAKAAAEALGLSENSIPAPGTIQSRSNTGGAASRPTNYRCCSPHFPSGSARQTACPPFDRDYAQRLALRTSSVTTLPTIGIAATRYTSEPSDARTTGAIRGTNFSHKRLYLLSIDPVGDGKVGRLRSESRYRRPHGRAGPRRRHRIVRHPGADRQG